MKFLNKLSVISLIVLMFSFTNIALAVSTAGGTGNYGDKSTNNSTPRCDTKKFRLGYCEEYSDASYKNNKVYCGQTYEYSGDLAYPCQWNDGGGLAYVNGKWQKGVAGCFRTTKNGCIFDDWE